MLDNLTGLSTDTELKFPYNYLYSLETQAGRRGALTPSATLNHPPVTTGGAVMHTIITQPGQDAHPDPDAAARQRADQLAKVSSEQMEAALAYLSMIDPQAFEIALTAAIPADDQIHEDDEAIPVCRQCGGLVGIFLTRGLQWQHFRGDGVTSGAQEIYDPGHAAEAVWILPNENPEEP
jgi:hypothetical protein